ncbi:hypothetical protein CN925_13325 [Bacillus sp. AFS055030]|nr:hypothetical protein CN925_13325 [Bacillus sp. AFS055030]
MNCNPNKRHFKKGLLFGYFYTIWHIPSVVKSSVYPGHILKVGTLDNSVRLVQEKLKIKADKIFGPTTENAVKDFQKNNV